MAVEHILCKVSLQIMASIQCTDRVVGAILASWRYDISGISPEMRKDYEHHFAECPHCRARQKFHRSLDVTLAVLTSLAVFFFLFALAVLKHIRPLEHVAFNVFGLDVADTYHMLVSAGIAGLCFSVIALLLVLTATPAPSYLGGIAAMSIEWNTSAKTACPRPSSRFARAKASSTLKSPEPPRAGGSYTLRRGWRLLQ